MDFDGWANSLGRQFAVIGEAPVPFAVAVILVALAIWKAFEWRYGAIFERQKEHIAHLERRPALAPASARPPEPFPASEPRRKWEPPNPEPSVPPERVFVPDGVTPGTLSTLVHGLNAIQAEKISESYKGKWIRITGAVHSSGVTSREAYFGVGPTFSGGDVATFLNEQVTAHFPKEAQGLDLVLHGSTVTLVGEIAKVTNHGLILVNCELIR